MFSITPSNYSVKNGQIACEKDNLPKLTHEETEHMDTSIFIKEFITLSEPFSLSQTHAEALLNKQNPESLGWMLKRNKPCRALGVQYTGGEQRHQFKNLLGEVSDVYKDHIIQDL